MIIYEIIGDDEEDLLSMATNGSEEPHGQAIMPVTQPATLPYKPAGVTPDDPNDEEFKVTLHRMESVEKTDVLVSCPPENSHGYLLIIVHGQIRCRVGPGFPDVKGKPVIKVHKKEKKISVTLTKATKGYWFQTWHDIIKKKPR